MRSTLHVSIIHDSGAVHTLHITRDMSGNVTQKMTYNGLLLPSNEDSADPLLDSYLEFLDKCS